jgi:hypothetical protein
VRFLTPGWLAALSAVAGVLSIILILDLTEYPYEVPRVLIFSYFLRQQDIGGSVVVIAIALAAWLPRTRSGALDFVEWLARHPWQVAAASFAGMCVAIFAAAHNHPLAGDEHLAIFQSRVFAAGRLTGEFPPELLFRLIPEQYQWRWLIANEHTGDVASMYWPGFSLLLAPFSLIGAPWACNPLLAALSLVLMAKLATRLSAVPQAGGWAMLFALGSPGFIGMALSYFSMTAHLFLNLLFAWLLVERTPKRIFAAGLVGSLALVQSNPVPHILFSLPWIASVARRPDARRNLARLAAGYAPLALLLGLGWWLFLRELQGKTPMAFYASEEDPLHRLGNLAWYLSLEFFKVFALWDWALASRILEQVRLWSWSVPGLALLAIAGWWLAREVAEAKLLALSLLCTLLGYLPVVFDQGSGWGARYVHPAFGALPVLASLAMVRAGSVAGRADLQSYVVRVALLSLVLFNALRLFQIHMFMRDQLSLRPPFENGARQIVFIASNPVNYAQDFLQNDPFLRAPVIFMMSRGISRDHEEIIRRRFPAARRTYEGPNGEVWRLD